MSTDHISFNDQLRKMNLIVYAMMGGVMVFIAISFYLRYSGLFYSVNNELDKIFKFLVPVLVFTGYLLGKTLFRVQLRKVKPDKGLDVRLKNYQIGAILQGALLEIPGSIAVLAFLLTGRALYLGFAILTIFALYFSRPTVEKVATELELTEEERQLLEKE